MVSGQPSGTDAAITVYNAKSPRRRLVMSYRVLKVTIGAAMLRRYGGT
jgi:hypothetical protein